MTPSLLRMLDRYYGGRNAAHLAAETELLNAEPTALEQAKAQRLPLRDDPIIPLMNQTLSGWHTNAAKSFEGSLTHMDRLEERAADTQRIAPRADGLADDIAALYGATPIPLLATRLVTQTNWPRWKVAGVLVYLAQQRELAALPALVRFERENKNPYYAKLLQEVLAHFGKDAVAAARKTEEGFRSRNSEVPPQTSPLVASTPHEEDDDDDDDDE